MPDEVIGSEEDGGTLDIEKCIEDAESYILDGLPERYKELARGYVYGEILVWSAMSTTVGATMKFYPVTTGSYILVKNIAPEYDMKHINTENNAAVLVEGGSDDFTINIASGAVAGMTLVNGDRIATTYQYSGWSLFDTTDPTKYYNVPRGLTRMANDLAAYYVLRHLFGQEVRACCSTPTP